MNFPHELQRFQAQDMGKLGAMQDLVRGVLKLAEFDEKKKNASTTDVIVATMLKRAEESLHKKDWDKAAEYFNNVLDYDVNNVDAYIGRLLVERKCVSVDDLAQQTQTLEASENYKKLIVLCSKEQKEKFKTIEGKIQQNHAVAQVLQKKRNKRIAIASTAAVLAAAVAVGAYFTATKVVIPGKITKQLSPVMTVGIMRRQSNILNSVWVTRIVQNTWTTYITRPPLQIMMLKIMMRQLRTLNPILTIKTVPLIWITAITKWLWPQ